MVTGFEVTDLQPAWVNGFLHDHDAIYLCEPRGIGGTQWTRKHPPNTVARSHYLLGRTVDSGRIWDIAATARYLRVLHKQQLPVHIVGETNSAVLAIYAALLEPEIAGLILREPPTSHMDASAPALLNVLRVCDVPEALGMVAPRPVTLITQQGERFPKASAVYAAAGAADKLVLRK